MASAAAAKGAAGGGPAGRVRLGEQGPPADLVLGGSGVDSGELGDQGLGRSESRVTDQDPQRPAPRLPQGRGAAWGESILFHLLFDPRRSRKWQGHI